MFSKRLKVDRWLQELKEKTTGSVRVYVAGNKVDIPEEKEISEEVFAALHRTT